MNLRCFFGFHDWEEPQPDSSRSRVLVENPGIVGHLPLPGCICVHCGLVRGIPPPTATQSSPARCRQPASRDAESGGQQEAIDHPGTARRCRDRHVPLPGTCDSGRHPARRRRLPRARTQAPRAKRRRPERRHDVLRPLSRRGNCETGLDLSARRAIIADAGRYATTKSESTVTERYRRAIGPRKSGPGP